MALRLSREVPRNNAKPALVSRAMQIRIFLVLVFFVLAACDRKVEPFDPTERPQQPDLAKLFPPEPRAESEHAHENEAPSDTRPLRGEIQISEDLKSRVPPRAVLFLIARVDDASPPLAVKRVPDPEFPLAFELGPDDRMIASVPFAGPLKLSVRIDADGNVATRDAGDLFGEAEDSYQPGDAGIVLRIDRAL